MWKNNLVESFRKLAQEIQWRREWLSLWEGAEGAGGRRGMRREKRGCLERQLDARSEIKMIRHADGCGGMNENDRECGRMRREKR